MKSIGKLVHAWYNNNRITSVIHDDKEEGNLVETNICNWISSIRVVGDKKWQVQVFLTIVIKKGFGELTKEQIPLLKKEGLALSIKHIIKEYVTKIRVLVGPNAEFANSCYYEKFI